MLFSPKILLFCTMVFFNSCCFDTEYCYERYSVKCENYTFLSDEEIEKSMEIQKPKEIEKAGKIYIYRDILLVNEANKGIHLIDNSDKTKPVAKAFIKLLGNLDIAVKEGYLYADSFDDLVVFDIRNIEAIGMVTRTKDIFPRDTYQAIPEDDYDFYYDLDCGFDSSKGMIVEVKS